MEFKNSTTVSSKVEEVNFKSLGKVCFIDFIQENKVSLYRLSKSILKSEADVQDAMSETIIKAYTNIHKLRLMDNFKSWIMKILVNECYNIISKILLEIRKIHDIFLIKPALKNLIRLWEFLLWIKA